MRTQLEDDLEVEKECTPPAKTGVQFTRLTLELTSWYRKCSALMDSIEDLELN